ncbi:MAG: cyclase family protein [Pseudonocardia sp.]|nr:cyclase family protein [Pseudonocardia sp.]
MQVRRIVDLSVPLGPGTQVYPGDPAPELIPRATLDRDGYNLLALHLGSQTGTHVDAPYHVRAHGLAVDALDPALCTGPATVVDVRGTPPKAPITADRVPDAPLRSIALVHTGWAAHYGTPAYFDHPFLHPDAVRRMLERGVRTFCIDAPSIDPTPDHGLAAHHLVADAGGVIGENFRNLELVDWPDPFVSCLPIKLEGADGAPVRAVAMELDGDRVQPFPQERR